MLFDFIFGKLLNPNIIILEFMIGSYKKILAQKRRKQMAHHSTRRHTWPLRAVDTQTSSTQWKLKENSLVVSNIEF